MSVYSIKDLEHLSGIKAHTIRIWEQRYEIFSPQRTSTNIRFYTEDDLKFILNISTLKNHGYRISKIVEMSMEDILSEVQKVTSKGEFFEDQIHSLTMAMVDMNEPLFGETLDLNIEKYGFEKTMMNIIYPFMGKIGILWLTNSINPAQEHFFTHLVRQKLIAEIDKLPFHKEAPLFLLFLPEGELHELGILLANYILKQRGMKTIFFGQTVPLNALEEVYHKLDPDFILTSLTTRPDPSAVQQFVNSLGSKFKDAEVLITGSRVVGQDISVGSNITVLNKFEDLEEVIAEVTERPSNP